MRNTLHIVLKNNHAFFFWLFAIAILILYDLTPRIDGFDTPYYFMAGELLWFGQLDCLRTPIYPLLLKFLSLFFDINGVAISITIIQSIVYLLSINSLRKITSYIINNRIIKNAICVLYIICVAPGWCNELMTESLSISGCVIITELICRYIHKQSWLLSIWISSLTLFLVFLRPSFIFLFAIQPVVWIVLWVRKTNKTLQLFSLSLTLCCSILYLSYCKSYEKEYGIFTSSLSFVCNDIYNLKRSNSWDINLITNPQAKEVLTLIDKQWCGNYAPIYQSVSSNHKNLYLIVSGCNEMKENSKKPLLRQRIKITTESFDKRFNASVNTHTPLSTVLFFSSLFFSLPLSIFYSIVIISCFGICVYILKKRHIPLTHAILFLFTTAQCVGILLYASEAHERLLLPVYPLFLVLIGIICDKKYVVNEQLNKIGVYK